MAPLQTLLEHVLCSEPTQEALLARAACAALSLPRARITLEAGSSRLELSAHQHKCQERPTYSGVRLRFCPGPSLRHWLPGEFSECGLLQARCQYSPLRVTLNGRCLSHDYQLGRCDEVWHCDGGHGLKAMWRETCKRVCRQTRGYSAWLGWSHTPQWGKTLLFLVRGVAYPVVPLIPGLRGVVLADHLRLDASQTQLVQNDDYLELIHELKCVFYIL